jgi:cytochrome b6-f complex iron-sulfur subunit
MADKDNMSIEEILAACRNADGEGGGSAAAPAPAAESAPVPEAAAPPAAAAPASGKPAGEMSVEEIMAAARGGASAAKKDAAPAAAPAAATGPAKKPSEMSVAEMLAAARGEKSAAAPAKAAPAGGKKAAAAAVAKASPKAPAAAAAGPRDTSSILAAARKPAKPGPMSKAEAAAKGKPVKAKPVAPPMPEKPAYAMPKPAPVDEDRRGMMTILFGSFLAIGFGALATWGGLVSVGLARFMFPNILTEPPSQFKVGFPSDFSPDTVTTKFKAQYGVWVVNSEYEGQQMITALKSVCTHLGCTPNWLEGEQKFKCPCHGSGFYKDGVNFEGPAPRPLERYAIRVSDDGQIEIDKSKKFQQEMGQWTNSSSFVPV